MAMGPGACGPIHVCRRLFGEATYTRVQQTMEAVVKKDAERFAKAWNFPIASTEGKAPLTQRNEPLSTPTKVLDPKELSTMGWQLIQPEASFYTTPPRKLKALRRLTPSVAQKTRSQLLSLQKPMTESVTDKIAITSGTGPAKTESIADLFNPFTKPTVNNFDTPSKSSVIPKTPILILPTPVDESIPLHHLEKLATQVQPNLTQQRVLQAPKSRLTILRSARHSEQLAKRQSDARVTDYYAIKRPRQSMK